MRGLFDAADRDDSALTQINFAAVKRKDVFFRQPLFECEREHCFGVLAAQGALRRQIGILDELLRYGRAALANAFVARIAQQSARYAKDIQSVMIEESPILDRSDRLDHDGGNVFESQRAGHAAFYAGVVSQRLRRKRE